MVHTYYNYLCNKFIRGELYINQMLENYFQSCPKTLCVDKLKIFQCFRSFQKWYQYELIIIINCKRTWL